MISSQSTQKILLDYDSLRPDYFLFTIVLGLFIIAIIIQWHLPINHDVSWLLEASRRMLNGGTYSKDFFENNPPFILYLYIPAILIKQLLHMSLVVAFRVYMLAICALSLVMSYSLINKMSSLDNKYIKNLIVIFLATIFLIFPIHDFGQREHFLLIFSVPYLLLVTNRLQGEKPSVAFAFWMGVLSALGFAIKPYFLFSLLSVEIFYLISTRKWRAWLRPEIAGIVLILSIYICTIMIVHTDYLNIVMPFAMKWCYSSCKMPFVLLVGHVVFLLSLVGMLGALMESRTSPLYYLLRVLACAEIGFLFSFLIQQTLFSYHMLPMISMALLMLALIYASYIQTSRIAQRDRIRIALLTFLTASLLYYFYPVVSRTILIFAPEVYFFSFGLLFCFILSLTCKSLNTFLMRLLSVPLIVGAGYLFSYMCKRTSLQSNTFELTSLLLILSISLFIPRVRNSRSNSIFVSLLGVLFFSISCYILSYSYYMTSKDSLNFKNLVHFLRVDARNHTVANLSSELFFQYIIDTDTQYISNYSFLWMLPGMIKQSYLSPQSQTNQTMINDQNFIIDKIAQNLNEKKPDYVLVDVSKDKNLFDTYDLKQNKRKQIPFDFLGFLLKNPHFQEAWKSYSYLKLIEDKQMFTSHNIEVYARRKY